MTPAKPVKLLIATFPYAGNGGISSLAYPIAEWLMKLSQVLDKDDRISHFYIKAFSDTPITMTRNQAVNAAKHAGCDFLLMIDSDMHPDLYTGAPPFFPTAFDFAYRRFLQGIPTVIAAPYCGPPGPPGANTEANTYFFRWCQLEEGPQTEIRSELRFIPRNEAALMTGIQVMAALPTGLILYDMKAFDLIEPPYFKYEWRDHTESEKVSTEDVTNTRDIALAGTVRGFGEVCYATMDSWAGHVKVKTMGKPQVLGTDAINENLKRAWVHPDARQDIADLNPPADANLPSTSEQGVVVKQRRLFGHKVSSVGHVTPTRHLECLADIVETQANEHPDRQLRVVEVGSWVGESAIALSQGLKYGGHVYCVEHFCGNPGDWTSAIAAELGREKLKAYWNKNTAGIESIRLFEGESQEVARSLDRQDIDVLFLDGDHSKEGLLADIRAWLPHMAPDGLLVGHDHVAMIPGVEAACREVFGNNYYQYDECPAIWLARVEDLDGDQGTEISSTAGDASSTAD